MKRKRLDESTHLLDPYPFEAYWWSSWHAVERLRIKDGAITMHVVDNGEVIEEMISMSNLRMRSRKATINDCSCILRPGLDVCVLNTSSDTKDSSEDSPDMKTADLTGNEKMKASASVRHIVLPCSTSARAQLIPDIIRCYGKGGLG